jgi:hypothetical protein
MRIFIFSKLVSVDFLFYVQKPYNSVILSPVLHVGSRILFQIILYKARISRKYIDYKSPVILSPQILSKKFRNLTTIHQDIIINKLSSSPKICLIIIGF